MRLAAVASMFCIALPAYAQFGTNLVQNSSFEDFGPSPTGTLSVMGLAGRFALSEWSVSSELTLDRYDGQFAPTTGTPPGGGAYYLFGGRTSLSTLTQDIDLSFASSAIASGHAEFTLSALLGSFKFGIPEGDVNQEDIATLRVLFLDANAAQLTVESIIGPNYPSEVGAPSAEGNFQGFFSRSGPVPVGAASARISIELARDPQPFGPTDFNNANIDLVGLVIVPAPGSVVAGLAGLMLTSRRRR